MRRTLGAWVQATRPFIMIVSFLPVVIGLLAAYRVTGPINWGMALLTLIGSMLAQVATNFSNDYFDYVQYEGSEPFSGGSGVIQAQLIAPRTLHVAGLILFTITGLIGLFLGALTGPFVAFLGLLGVAGGFFYSGPPLRLGYRGLAELDVSLSMGPSIVLGTYLVQTGDALMLTGESVLAYVARVLAAGAWPLALSVPIGSFVALVLYAESIYDIDQDLQTGKLTLAARLGFDRALAAMIGWVLLTCLYLVAGVFLWQLPWLLLLSLAPMVWVVTRLRRVRAAGPPDTSSKSAGEVEPLGRLALLLYTAVALLTIVGLAVSG